MKYKWDDASAPWTEDDLQLAQAQWLRREGFVFAADQNAGKRSKRDGAKRKLLGMASGDPDLRIYLKGGRLLLIENKRASDGRLSKAQIDRHKELKSVGHIVHTIVAVTPNDAVAQLQGIVEAHR